MVITAEKAVVAGRPTTSAGKARPTSRHRVTIPGVVALPLEQKRRDNAGSKATPYITVVAP